MIKPPDFSKALCRSYPSLFFSSNCDDRRNAKAICYRCSILALCREYTMRLRPEYGVFAGTTPAERRKIIRELKLAKGGNQ